jgi:hypothetical protein
MFQHIVEYYCGMAVEMPWQNPLSYGQDIVSDQKFTDNSPLALAVKKAEVKFTVWDIRLLLDTIKERVASAPNIDHDSDVEVIHCIGSESLWRILNSVDDGASPARNKISVDIGEVYRFKRVVSKIFEESGNIIK